MPSVIVYGGSGALGAAIVRTFKRQAWHVICIDLRPNPDADDIITVGPSTSDLSEHGAAIANDVEAVARGAPVDAVLCVAGGWQGGSAKSKSFLKNAQLSIDQSVNSSLVAASIAAHHLRPGGLLAFTGAIPALEGGTPGMVGYGLAKAAVHHLVTSLAMPKSGIEDPCVIGILPETLDTPANRQSMPNADHSRWTPLKDMADILFQWAAGQASQPCQNGRLYKIITRDSITSVE
ncbi:hypothetical protein GGF46_004118 [Coemansia sp. RSA 552]|nr:hypothetical protein GGF46_004118 [Coemansia sp. RSA 552]